MALHAMPNIEVSEMPMKRDVAILVIPLGHVQGMSRSGAALRLLLLFMHCRQLPGDPGEAAGGVGF